MQFRSSLKFQDPDTRSYETQKDLSIIRAESDPLSGRDFSMLPPKPKALLGNGNTCLLWGAFYAPRLAAAAEGRRGHYTAQFPGHTVPGAGAGQNTRYTGSLMIERLEHLLELSGALPPLGPFASERLTPKHEIENLPLEDWAWEQIAQPRLKLLKPARIQRQATADEVTVLLNWAKDVVWQYIKQDKIPVRELLGFIRELWSSYTKAPVYSPETLQTAQEVLSHFKINSRRESRDWLALVFELEACLTYFECSWPLNISGYGVFNSSWVEVGRLPIAEIQCAELVVTKRVLQELVNIRIKGFAPIVINEYHGDTDGTHRLVATWIWNLLCSLVGVSTDLRNAEFQDGVARFVAEHAKAMGSLVVREALLSLSRILVDVEMNAVLHDSVLPHVSRYYPVTHLPVLLLPEYLCGAVIKGPYDEGVGSFRVDPTVYETLAQDRSYTLPARGPYHLTDRALLPWFTVLERR